MDTVSMIYCYLLYSYDTQRFNKEKKLVIMETAGTSSWSAVTDSARADNIDIDDNDDAKEESVNTTVMSMITGLLTEKRKRARGRRRFHGDDDDEKWDDTETVDFAAISQVISVTKFASFTATHKATGKATT